MQAQHTPILLAASQECKNDLIQIYKQIAGGEPAILGTNNLLELEQQIKALNLQVPFIGEELQISQATYWSQVYTFLGIQSLPRKSERMIEDEVSANNEPTDLMALDPLTARRQACKKLNERFANYLDAPIRVVWRKDNESDNYNLIHNMKFWSSGILTGNQTVRLSAFAALQFWSSGILTGNQTRFLCHVSRRLFWSSGILTGNQTAKVVWRAEFPFWSSGILTGNQTLQH